MIHYHPNSQSPFLLTNSLVLSILLFTSPCLSVFKNHHRPYHLPLPNRIITQFPHPTWLENIAVRHNGNLLLTESAPLARLHLVTNPYPYPDPDQDQEHSSSPPNGSEIRRRTTIHTFDSVQALFGITEPVADLFVVMGGNISASESGSGSGTGVAEGSWFFAWTVDFRLTRTTSSDHESDQEKNPKPKITQITHLSKALLPNGLASIPDNSDIVLIADSFAGLVWHLDIRTGDYDIAVKVPEMGVPANGSGVVVGVNGIKTHKGGYLYWTNSAAVKIYRVRLDRNGYHDGNGTAAVELVVDLSSPATFLDDFAIDADGVIWVATNSGNQLYAIYPKENKVMLIGGGETELTFAGDTAAAFSKDWKTLYVTTCGGLRTPINGTVTEGGKVVAVDTSGFSWL